MSKKRGSYQFTNGEFLRADTLMPISDSEIKTKAAELDFSVTNEGTEHMNLTISLTDIEISDDLKDVDFRWGLYNKDTGVGLSFGIFKDVGTSKSMVIYRDTIIDAVLDENEEDITKNYTLRVWIHDDGANQNYMQGETFSAKVTVDGEPISYTPESCFGFEDGTITNYHYYEDTDELYNKACGADVVIPKTIGGEPVTAFDDTDSEGFGLVANNLIIPDTITTFGTIYGVYVDHVTIPESVTFASIDVGDIKSIMIPESVQDLYLIDNTIEKTVVIPGNVENVAIHIGDAGEPNTIENIIFMDGITKISEEAFKGNYSLTTIEIPSTVTSIGKDAFESNDDLTEIVVRGKTSAPSGFAENWDCKFYDWETGECTERYNVVFRP
ncbi:MAG: hypothetical protein E7166_01830 [Firmicutes bacterium]|nr:hypothetical protein [Bacillota bacterium]